MNLIPMLQSYYTFVNQVHVLTKSRDTFFSETENMHITDWNKTNTFMSIGPQRKTEKRFGPHFGNCIPELNNSFSRPFIYQSVLVS